MVEALNVMFPTLMSKTFLLLSLSLLFTVAGAYLVILYFRNAYAKGAKYVKNVSKEPGVTDLQIETGLAMKLFWPALIINILFFIIMMLFRTTFPINIILMGCYTLTMGLMLGVLLIIIDENLAMRVAWLTAFITFGAAVVAMYSGIDFSFLSGFLFWGLLGLIGIQIVRIFIGIHGLKRKLIAGFGVVLFIGYLLYDFNNLHKARKVRALNTWLVALNYSISIYLDIINLFLYLLDLLSED